MSTCVNNPGTRHYYSSRYLNKSVQLDIYPSFDTSSQAAGSASSAAVCVVVWLS